jgi:hypothetical protein
MVMDDLIERFAEKAPIATMVRASLERVFADRALDDLFARNAINQYTKNLTFSTVTKLMCKVVLRTHDTIHAAVRFTGDIPVSITAVYDKLARLEVGISEALVAETADGVEAIIDALPDPPTDTIPGLRLRTLDGNFLAGTDHRLDCLRHCGAAALPGMSLVVRDGRTGLLTHLIGCEDAYTNERSLADRLLPLVRANDLWLADRNFCTEDYLGGIAERRAFFVIRHHAGTKLRAITEPRRVSKNKSGDIFQQKVGVGPLVVNCILIRLFQPLRDGTTEIRLLTNVPATKAGARRLAELYRRRWQIETAFQELTQYLRCEVTTLGYPRAALFGFALAVAAYNVMILTKRAIGSHAGHDQVDRELSVYYLATEIATVSDGMAIAVPEQRWQRFARMSDRVFARWLHKTAARINWRRYRKTPRGPTKPVKVVRTRRGAHRSTARVLAKHK